MSAGPWELYDGDVVLWGADSRKLLPTLADASVDAVVTDPPYELGFMGKAWDRDGVAYDVELWRQCLRVLRPGGHLLAFGGTRTSHRLSVAVEDAGFDIRDAITWLYGQGFPKSLDLAKAIDRRAGERTEPVGTARMTDHRHGSYGDGPGRSSEVPVYADAAVTDDAKRWEGWGTALKPASEPIVVARKPVDGNVVDNVLVHGTGALNVDGCRIAVADDEYARNHSGDRGNAGSRGAEREGDTDLHAGGGTASEAGRWPPNVVLTHSPDCDDACVPGCPVRELDAQAGIRTSGANPTRRGSDKFRDAYGTFRGQEECEPARGAEVGGASRFFPVFRFESKATTGERPRDGEVAHPTVKPLELMRWLVRLVTPPGGLVLDPFAGSGTTAEAALREGMRAWLVENDPAYCALVRARLARPQQAAML